MARKKNKNKNRKLNFFALATVAVVAVGVGFLCLRFFSTSKLQAAEPVFHAAAETVFKDVSSDQPSFEAIAYLKKHDMIEGYKNGIFKPNGLVTRAELLKFLFEAQKIYPSPAVYRACFADVQDEWFAPYVCYAQAKDLLVTFTSKKFVPTQNVTGEEALQILLLAFKNEGAQSVNVHVDESLLTRAQLAEILYGLLLI